MVIQQYRAWSDCTDVQACLDLYWWPRLITFSSSRIRVNVSLVKLNFSTIDESPATCKVFLNEGGLDLFMTTLQVVSSMEVDTRVQVETKILGLLVSYEQIIIMLETFIFIHVLLTVLAL